MLYNQSGGFLSTIPTVTKNIIIINLLLWLASLKFTVMTDWLGLHFFLASDFKIHQVVTYMFMHSTRFDHVFFNMFAVLMFGRVLEQTWGPKRFLIFYMVTGIGAALIQELTWYIDMKPFLDDVNRYLLTGEVGNLGKYWSIRPGELYTDEAIMTARDQLLNRMVTIGASGAVFGILLGFGMLFPDTPLFIMFIPIPIKAKWMVIGYGVLELFAGVSNFAFDNVAHFAHLGGMLFGYFLIIYWRKKGIGGGFSDNWQYGDKPGVIERIKRWFKDLQSKWQSGGKKKDFHRSSSERTNSDQAYRDQRKADNDRCDAILDKIKQSGYDSLTVEEKRFLFEQGKK